MFLAPALLYQLSFLLKIFLRSWWIPIRQIGYEVGRKGIKDAEIIPYKEQEFAQP